MAWSRIDDSLHSHPKVMQVGNAATGLYVRLISYAGQHLTDGFVPASIARSYGTPRLLGALCDAQLLHKVESNSNHTSSTHQPFKGPGYVIHDYLDYNPSRAQVEAERKKNAARQEAFRQRKNGKPIPPDGASGPSSNGVSNGVTNGATNGVSNGAPTRPDPTRPTDTADVGGDSAGSTAPDLDHLAPTPIEIDGFQLTDTMRRWAHATYPGLDVEHATAQFVSHYRSTGARRKSWPDAWQKWIRDDAKRAAERGPRHLPAAVGASVIPLTKPRHQQETDDWFERSLTRARARDAAAEGGTA